MNSTKEDKKEVDAATTKAGMLKYAPIFSYIDFTLDVVVLNAV